MAKLFGKKFVFGGVFGLLAVAGIIVGILFATGVLKTNSSSGGSKPTPVIPGKTTGSPVSTTLSNANIAWETIGGEGSIPTGVTFNVSYSPSSGGFPAPDGIPLAQGWMLNQIITSTYQDGSTYSNTIPGNGIYYISTVDFQAFNTGGFGLNRVPTKVDVKAYLSYVDNNGNTVNGPVSNTLSIDVPPAKN